MYFLYSCVGSSNMKCSKMQLQEDISPKLGFTAMTSLQQLLENKIKQHKTADDIFLYIIGNVVKTIV